ncbi:hypothetical protein ACFVXE_14130 [Streptomyces sp. NPDC058231]|uniref:hypothetical protein n=1 Tax=Streptomyces sp. NPDC058231 TaxID=3346392 RepID=UPI0036ECD44F
MAWDEWEELKAEALARRQNHMRLNSAGGGDAPDLKTNAPGRKAAIKALREDIRPGTDKAGAHADESSDSAVREFSGWDTGSGLKAALEEWGLQVKHLKGRLEGDQSALAQTGHDFQYVDFDVRNRMTQVGTGHDRHGA